MLEHSEWLHLTACKNWRPTACAIENVDWKYIAPFLRQRAQLSSQLLRVVTGILGSRIVAWQLVEHCSVPWRNTCRTWVGHCPFIANVEMIAVTTKQCGKGETIKRNQSEEAKRRPNSWRNKGAKPLTRKPEKDCYWKRLTESCFSSIFQQDISTPCIRWWLLDSRCDRSVTCDMHRKTLAKWCANFLM